jgi:hypothetical protein
MRIAALAHHVWTRCSGLPISARDLEILTLAHAWLGASRPGFGAALDALEKALDDLGIAIMRAPRNGGPLTTLGRFR